jgi:hypothetical protein
MRVCIRVCMRARIGACVCDIRVKGAEHPRRSDIDISNDRKNIERTKVISRILGRCAVNFGDFQHREVGERTRIPYSIRFL